MPRADAGKQIDLTFESLLGRLDELEHDDLDVDGGDGKITISFADGGPLILSRQGAVAQIWLAEPRGGWHFDWDGSAWRCDKRGVELVATLEDLIAARLDEPVDLGA